MTAPIQWVRLPFEGMPGGVELPPDNEPHVNQLYNWELARVGGLTPRPMWINESVTSLPNPLRARGLDSSFRTEVGGTGIRQLEIVHYDGTNFDFWVHQVEPGKEGSPKVDTAAWTQIDANVGVAAAYRGVPVAFAAGSSTISGADEALYYGNPGFTGGGTRRGRYQVTGVANAIATDQTAGYCAAFHLDRFWTGVVGDLKFSEIGNITDWNVSENFIPVGFKNLEIYSLLPFDGGMLIGKGDGLWWLAGKTLDTFQRVNVTDKMGVAPGYPSMVETPHGVFIMGIDSNLYVYDGAQVRRVNKDYRLSNATVGFSAGGVSAIPQQFSTMAWVFDRLFITRFGSASGNTVMDVYVPEIDAWYRETFPTSGPDGETVFGGFVQRYTDSYLLHARMADTGDAEVNNAALTYRQQDGQLAFGAGALDDHHPVNEVDMSRATQAGWSWWPRTMGKVTIKEVFLRYRFWMNDSGSPPVSPYTHGITVQIVSEEGDNQSHWTGVPTFSGEYLTHLDFGVTGRDFNIYARSIPDDGSSSAAEQEGYQIREIWVGYLPDIDRR